MKADDGDFAAQGIICGLEQVVEMYVTKIHKDQEDKERQMRKQATESHLKALTRRLNETNEANIESKRALQFRLL